MRNYRKQTDSPARTIYLALTTTDGICSVVTSMSIIAATWRGKDPDCWVNENFDCENNYPVYIKPEHENDCLAWTFVARTVFLAPIYLTCWLSFIRFLQIRYPLLHISKLKLYIGVTVVYLIIIISVEVVYTILTATELPLVKIVFFNRCLPIGNGFSQASTMVVFGLPIVVLEIGALVT